MSNPALNYHDFVARVEDETPSERLTYLTKDEREYVLLYAWELMPTRNNVSKDLLRLVIEIALDHLPTLQRRE